MDNLNDLKSIWLTAKTDDLPTSLEMVQLVKKFRNEKIGKKKVLIVLAFILSMVMVVVIVMSKSMMLTTEIAEVFILATCVILAITNINSIKRFYNLHDCNNKEFLQFIEQTRQNQIYYYKKTQFIGLLFCSCGLLLYPYEFVYRNTLVLITVYSFAMVYLLILWFVIRPKKFKKGIKQLNETRERIEKILKQLN